MKDKIIKKLNCRRGAALIIALVIFLLCALAGASALIMAAANAGRYSHSDEQEYYSVSSAALMVVDMMDELTYQSSAITYTYERNWEYVGSGSGQSEHTTSDGYHLKIGKAADGSIGRFLDWATDKEGGASSIRTGKGTEEFCNTIKNQCDLLVQYLSVPQEWYDSVRGKAGQPQKPTADDVKTVTYELQITVENNTQFGTVNCKLVMADNYNLTLTFTSASTSESTSGSADDQASRYSITVYWVPTVTAEPKAKEPVYEYTTPTGGGYRTGYMTQEHTLTVKVKWEKENVTISRGDATTTNPGTATT